jgi:hypothetical protein
MLVSIGLVAATAACMVGWTRRGDDAWCPYRHDDLSLSQTEQQSPIRHEFTHASHMGDFAVQAQVGRGGAASVRSSSFFGAALDGAAMSSANERQAVPLSRSKRREDHGRERREVPT